MNKPHETLEQRLNKLELIPYYGPKALAEAHPNIKQWLELEEKLKPFMNHFYRSDLEPSISRLIGIADTDKNESENITQEFRNFLQNKNQNNSLKALLEALDNTQNNEIIKSNANFIKTNIITLALDYVYVFTFQDESNEVYIKSQYHSVFNQFISHNGLFNLVIWLLDYPAHQAFLYPILYMIRSYLLFHTQITKSEIKEKIQAFLKKAENNEAYENIINHPRIKHELAAVTQQFEEITGFTVERSINPPQG